MLAVLVDRPERVLSRNSLVDLVWGPTAGVGVAHERQEIVLAARPTVARHPVRFVLDGHALGSAAAPFEFPWKLALGRHELVAESDGIRGAPVSFEVADAR